MKTYTQMRAVDLIKILKQYPSYIVVTDDGTGWISDTIWIDIGELENGKKSIGIFGK